MTVRVFTAAGTEGPLFAACDPDAHHVEASVATRRFPAILSPFRTEEAARLALIRAGGSNVQEHVR